MIGNTKITTKLIALLIFAIILVVSSNVVELLNESDTIIIDRELANSNNNELNEEVTLIKANAIIDDVKELEIVAKVIVEEEEEVEEPVIVYDGLTMEELIDKLNRNLNGTIAGTGSSFATYAIEFGIDPYLAIGIVLQETGCYYGTCSAMVNECYNVGGMKGTGSYSCWGGSYAGFNTLDEGIRSYMNNLYNNYISKGLTTAETMNSVYAEDPLWASRVNNYINIIRNN